MKTPKAYRVIVPYNVYPKGYIIYPTGTLADSLMDTGYIEPVPEDEEDDLDSEGTLETALAGELETATVKRKVGRPRKALV